MDDTPINPSVDDPRVIDPLLRAYLADRDVPCPLCGYNLRTLLGDRCTECGVVVRLGVQPSEPILRAWLVALVQAALGAGVGLMFLALTLGRAGMPPLRYWWMVGLAWACVPIAALILFRRRSILRWSAPAQWSLAAILFVVLLALGAGLATTR